MPTVELDIRQLADKGGTEPFAPITVTDAVLDEDGNTLTDTLDEIKSGLMLYPTEYTKVAELTSGQTYTIAVNGWYRIIGDTTSSGKAGASFNGQPLLFQENNCGRMTAILPLKAGCVIAQRENVNIVIHFLQAI